MAQLDDLVASYLANVDYEASKSIAKAQAFVAAAVGLSLLKPKSVTIDGNTTSWDSGAVTTELARARNWLSANQSVDASANSSGSSRSRYYDMSDIRN